MFVQRFTSVEELTPWREGWNALARGVPTRRWEWLAPWWQAYGADRRLYVLGVFNEDRLTGLAPWFVEDAGASGRRVRFLGSGEVCSDYLTLLCRPEDEEPAAAAVAEWLLHAADRADDRWDLLELANVAADDAAIPKLVAHLAEEGCGVHHRPGQNTWRVPLPATWDEYVAMLSKSHRKQVKSMVNRLAPRGPTHLRSVETAGELPEALRVLIDLHQARRNMLGQPGCFADERFTRFLTRAAAELYAEGAANVYWLELDGRPLAIDFDLEGAGVRYTYQTGVDITRLDESPGRLLNTALIRAAIEGGRAGLDFMRGDEPYKAHFRADPLASWDIRVAAPHPAARLRHGVWLLGHTMKSWIKAGLKLTGMR